MRGGDDIAGTKWGDAGDAELPDHLPMKRFDRDYPVDGTGQRVKDTMKRIANETVAGDGDVDLDVNWSVDKNFPQDSDGNNTVTNAVRRQREAFIKSDWGENAEEDDDKEKKGSLLEKELTDFAVDLKKSRAAIADAQADFAADYEPRGTSADKVAESTT